MSSTTFINLITLTDAGWFNDVNDTVYDILGDGINVPASKAAVRTNIGINNLTQDLTPDPSADYIETYDASAASSKKVLLSSLKITSATPQASTSGTSIDFTSIPAGVKRIVIGFFGVSLNGSANLLVQIGDSGGIENSGYLGSYSIVVNSSATTAGQSTAGFIVGASATANTLHGTMILTLMDTSNNTWIQSHTFGLSNVAAVNSGGGSKQTSAVLDRVRITSTNGTDAFDAGTINILYE